MIALGPADPRYPRGLLDLRLAPDPLTVDGETIAVLGAGIASYLEEVRGRRRRLAQAIRRHGALVSEFPPDAPAQRWTFAQRDLTIAALGEVTVVAEAPVDSGALITAAE